MADGNVDTSIYPRANQNSLIEGLGQVQALKNAAVQNQLLQTEAQRAGVGLSQDKINLAHQQFGQLSSFLGSLAQDPRISTDAGPGLLKQATAQAVQQGWITPDIANSEIANMPTDPAQIPQYLQSLNTRIQDAAGQFSKIYGEPTTISNGSQTLPVTASPITGIRPIAAPITQTLSPESRATLVPGTNAQGQPTLTPAATILQGSGLNPMTVQPQTAPNGPVNRLVPFDQNNPAPVQSAQGGSVAMGPPAGQVEAQTQAAKVSSDKYSADAAAQTNYQQSILPIEQAYKSVKALGTTGVGPGSEELNQMKSFLVTVGFMNPTENLKDFDEANKYLTQMARSTGFTGSDAQLAAAQQASPSMKTSNGAALAVLQKAASLARMQNAQVRAFEASGQGPEKYSKWATNWNSSQNPVAYAFDMMTPEDRLAYVKTLKDADLAKFKASLKTATDLGLVTPPQQSASPANGG
jgi:hypothetical protein